MSKQMSSPRMTRRPITVYIRPDCSADILSVVYKTTSKTTRIIMYKVCNTQFVLFKKLLSTRFMCLMFSNITGNLFNWIVGCS